MFKCKLQAAVTQNEVELFFNLNLSNVEIGPELMVMPVSIKNHFGDVMVSFDPATETKILVDAETKRLYVNINLMTDASKTRFNFNKALNKELRPSIEAFLEEMQDLDFVELEETLLQNVKARYLAAGNFGIDLYSINDAKGIMTMRAEQTPSNIDSGSVALRVSSVLLRDSFEGMPKAFTTLISNIEHTLEARKVVSGEYTYLLFTVESPERFAELAFEVAHAAMAIELMPPALENSFEVAPEEGDDD